MSSIYKALIVYSSITGNTEKIAEAFAETFREYNITPTLMKLEGNYLGEQMDPPDTGSYFFHNQMWNHPNERNLNKAKYLVADLVEDYFLTFDGQRGFVNSKYVSIS